MLALNVKLADKSTSADVFKVSKNVNGFYYLGRFYSCRKDFAVKMCLGSLMCKSHPRSGRTFSFFKLAFQKLLGEINFSSVQTMVTKSQFGDQNVSTAQRSSALCIFCVVFQNNRKRLTDFRRLCSVQNAEIRILESCE